VTCGRRSGGDGVLTKNLIKRNSKDTFLVEDTFPKLSCEMALAYIAGIASLAGIFLEKRLGSQEIGA
jgi:hypothetical protein